MFFFFCVYWRSVSRVFFLLFFVMETVEKCDAFASLDPMTCQRKMQGTDWLILFKQQQTSLFLHRLNQHSADWEFPMKCATDNF